MLKLTVSQDGSGDFASISEAVLAVPYELESRDLHRARHLPGKAGL